MAGTVSIYNETEDDFFLLVGDTNLSQTPFLLTTVTTMLVLCAALGMPMVINVIYTNSIIGNSHSDTIRNYAIVAFVLVLCFIIPLILVYDFYNINTLRDVIQNIWIKHLTLFGAASCGLYGFVAGFVIAYWKSDKWTISNYTPISIILQGIGIGLVVGFFELLAFHGLFTVFFLLLTTSPQHIAVSIVFYGASLFALIVLTTLLIKSFVRTYRINYLENKSKIWTGLSMLYITVVFIFFYIFLAVFVYTFSEFISFTVVGDSSGVIATLAPSALLALFGSGGTYILQKLESIDSKNEKNKKDNKSDKDECDGNLKNANHVKTNETQV